MLNLNHLRTFHHAARFQNFSVAARNLFVTQPAITAHIKLFEEFCNFELFQKKGRKMYLTDEGKTIFKFTSSIFEQDQDLERVIYDMRKQHTKII